MTRRDYITFASLIHDHRDSLPPQFVADFALILKEDNPRFNASRFLDAACFPELIGTKQGLN